MVAIIQCARRANIINANTSYKSIYRQWGGMFYKSWEDIFGNVWKTLDHSVQALACRKTFMEEVGIFIKRSVGACCARFTSNVEVSMRPQDATTWMSRTTWIGSPDQLGCLETYGLAVRISLDVSKHMDCSPDQIGCLQTRGQLPNCFGVLPADGGLKVSPIGKATRSRKTNELLGLVNPTLSSLETFRRLDGSSNANDYPDVAYMFCFGTEVGKHSTVCSVIRCIFAP